jgi:LacI family transcriptional regulator
VSVDEGRKVTIDVIAREAGVSVPIVSEVLSGGSPVGGQTRERIEELLGRYGYRPQPNPERATIGLIDVVFDHLDAAAVEILNGVEQVAGAGGTGVVVSTTAGRSTSIERWLRNVRTRGSDGLVLAAPDLAAPVHPELTRLDVPLVLVNLPADAADGRPSVGPDDRAAGRRATEHLLALGHGRIACLAATARADGVPAAVAGYRDAMAARGVPVLDELVRPTESDVASAQAAATVLLYGRRAPTAIVATSEEIAVGVYAAARERGLRIPRDLSVVGLDDLPAARWAEPPLTAVRRPLAEAGVLAARTLLRLIAGESVAAPHLALATELVVRESTSAPASR